MSATPTLAQLLHACPSKSAMQCNALQNYDSINDPCHVTLTSAEDRRRRAAVHAVIVCVECYFGLWNQVFPDYVGSSLPRSLACSGQTSPHKYRLVLYHRSPLELSSVRSGRDGGHCRSSLRYSYNAGSAGVVNGTWDPLRRASGVWVFC